MDIRKAISDAITSLSKSTQVTDSVVTEFVKRELNKRSTAIVTVLDLLSREKQNSYKLKPDVQVFDIEGKVTSESYTKARTEEIKKNKELIEKYERALEKALDKDDYSDVYSIANSAKS